MTHQLFRALYDARGPRALQDVAFHCNAPAKGDVLALMSALGAERISVNVSPTGGTAELQAAINFALGERGAMHQWMPEEGSHLHDTRFRRRAIEAEAERAVAEGHHFFIDKAADVLQSPCDAIQTLAREGRLVLLVHNREDQHKLEVARAAEAGLPESEQICAQIRTLNISDEIKRDVEALAVQAQNCAIADREMQTYYGRSLDTPGTVSFVIGYGDYGKAAVKALTLRGVPKDQIVVIEKAGSPGFKAAQADGLSVRRHTQRVSADSRPDYGFVFTCADEQAVDSENVENFAARTLHASVTSGGKGVAVDQIIAKKTQSEFVGAAKRLAPFFILTKRYGSPGWHGVPAARRQLDDIDVQFENGDRAIFLAVRKKPNGQRGLKAPNLFEEHRAELMPTTSLLLMAATEAVDLRTAAPGDYRLDPKQQALWAPRFRRQLETKLRLLPLPPESVLRVSASVVRDEHRRMSRADAGLPGVHSHLIGRHAAKALGEDANERLMAPPDPS